VNTPLDLIDERQMNEGRRWMYLRVGEERFKLPKIPVAMRQTAEFEVREQPGCLGEHTDAILAALGYPADEIDRLKSERVVLRSDRMLNTETREG